MAIVERRNREELARLGTEHYQKILPQLASEDRGKFVAIDVHTGEYELAKDDCTAVTKLLERLPTADVWLERAGFTAAYKMGLRSLALIQK